LYVRGLRRDDDGGAARHRAHRHYAATAIGLALALLDT
jgi:hypothetical protein